MFKTHPILLSQLLKEIDEGKMQLPEFQREWIWDDFRIRDLLTSVAQGFPIGAIMRLEAGGELDFKSRPIKGAKPLPIPKPDTLLLDGQQRMTSLYQALQCSCPVSTYNSSRRKVKRWYYVNMVEALREVPNYEKTIFSVPCKKQLTSNFGHTVELDISSLELEYKQHMMPTKYLLVDTAYWMLGYISYWNVRDYPHGSPIEFFTQFQEEIVDTFKNFPLPVIDLDKKLPREAICLVFEKVNTGGIALTTFELLTAILAAQRFDLPEDWDTRWKRMQEWRYRDVLKKINKDQFIRAVALLVTSNRRDQAQREGRAYIPAVSCRRSDILSISREEYEKWAGEAEKGFKRAARFLIQQSIFSARDIPYITQVTSLAVILALVGDKSANTKRKLARWFWTGIFGEIYAGPTDTVMANDVQRVPEFLRADVSLQMLEEATFEPARLLSLRTRATAAYKGINALLMKKGAVDWRENEPISLASYYADNIDIHHIFPKRWCKKDAPHLIGSEIPPWIFNSAINKTPLSARTNQIIGGSAPSAYVEKLRPDASNIDSAIRGHKIAFEHLQNDDFASFFVERGMALMRLISEAMGKKLTDGEGEEVFKGALKTAGLRSKTDD